MTCWGIHPTMSPLGPCKSKGQHLFRLVVFMVCSSGSNSGGFQLVVMFIDSLIDDVTYVRDVEVCL